MELNPPEDDQLSEIEEHIEEEVTEIKAETMEQYMSKTREDHGSGVTRPTINQDTPFELKGKFLKELHDNTFSGSIQEDSNEHIKKCASRLVICLTLVLHIELADSAITATKRPIALLCVRIGKFVFPIDFVILDIPKDNDVPLILGRPFCPLPMSRSTSIKEKLAKARIARMSSNFSVGPCCKRN
ncbi:hypothetical protein Tco_1300783 [Tanacetum coccineum]